MYNKPIEEYVPPEIKLKDFREAIDDETILNFLKSIPDDQEVRLYYTEKYLDSIEFRLKTKELN
jgi:hypothetical protein